MGKVIGIDLGTTEITLSAYEDNKPIIFAHINGIIDELLFNFNKDATNNKSNKSNVEDFFNSSFLTASQVLIALGTDKKFNFYGNIYTPEELMIMILRKLCVEAESHLNKIIDCVVISVPYNFNDNQKRALIESAKKAGLGIRIADRIAMSGIAYGWKIEENKKILVCDLYAGIFCCGIIEVGDYVGEVLSINGDDELGCGDFNRKTIEWLATESKNSDNKDLILPYSLYNELTTILALKVKDIIMNTIKEVGISLTDIDDVILSGSIERISAIRDVIIEIIDKEPLNTISPEECVAYGTAVWAGILNGEIKDLLFLDVTSLSIGLKTQDNQFIVLVEKNTPIPAKRSRVLTINKDDKKNAEILILQGNSKYCDENIIIKNIKPESHYSNQIEINVDIDTNGIVNVSTK